MCQRFLKAKTHWDFMKMFGETETIRGTSIRTPIHRDIDWIRLSVWLWYVKALLQVEGVMPWQGVASLKKHGNDLYVWDHGPLRPILPYSQYHFHDRSSCSCVASKGTRMMTATCIQWRDLDPQASETQEFCMRKEKYPCRKARNAFWSKPWRL